MYKTFVFFILALCMLGGCISSEPILLYGSGNRKKNKSYTLGQAMKATPGSPLISGTAVVTKITYQSEMDYQPPNVDAKSNQPKITKGMKFEVWGRLQNDTSKLIIYNGNYTNGIIISRDGYVYKGWISMNRSMPGAVMGEGEFTKEKLFEFVSATPNQEAFKAEVLLTNVSGNKLSLTYNEYGNPTNNKVTKTDDLIFDVSSNKIIEYKDLKIEVMSISGNEVQYKVVSDGGGSWIR